MFPFWSPDSRSIWVLRAGKLKKIQIAGGPPQTLCDAVQPRGGDVGPRERRSCFSAGNGHELNQRSRPAACGRNGRLRRRHQPGARAAVSSLPDARQFLYVRTAAEATESTPARSTRRGPLSFRRGVSGAAAYVSEHSPVHQGHLARLRGRHAPSRGPSTRRRSSRPAIREAVVDRILNVTNLGRGAFSASDNGTWSTRISRRARHA